LDFGVRARVQRTVKSQNPVEDQKHEDQKHEDQKHRVAVASQRVRTRVLLLLGGAGVALFVLATGLSTLTLQSGKPLIVSARSVESARSVAPEGGDWVIVFIRVVLAFFILAIPVTLIMMIFDKNLRRRFVRILMICALLLLLARGSHLPRFNFRRPSPTAVVPKETRQPIDADRVEPHVPSSGLVLAVTIGIALLLVGLAWWWIRRQRTGVVDMHTDDLSETAQQAADDLRSGNNVEETVQRCYLEMCEVLQRERGVTRSVATTPSEFQSTLIARDVPAEAVETLTSLFERIRYGGGSASSDDQQRAIISLDSIAAATRDWHDAQQLVGIR
jgi:Domain of unknown function (DUF4129)